MDAEEGGLVGGAVRDARRVCWLLVLVVVLSGCSPLVWVKEGGTAQQFEQDRFDCEQRVITMYGDYTQLGQGFASMARQEFDRCLEIKGYRKVTEEDRARMQHTPDAAAP
jgi:hypothetical protein